MIYSKGKVVGRHHFKPQELDEIKKICYDMGIKYYIINYNMTYEELKEYEKGVL